MSGPYDVLSRITSRRPQPVAGERCEMCAEDIGDHHQHVVDVVGRQLMCVCRGCYLLFTDSRADLRYRAVPDRFLSFPEFTVDRHAWSALQIPVEVAFFFRNSALHRVVAFYPGAAGACESELELDLWDAVTAGDDRSALLADDVEALLIRMPEIGTPQCFLLPIDTCYEFVGGLRSLWRGFDGGTDVHAFIDGFFGTIGERAKDVPP